MTNDKTVSEIIGETAANRDRAIAEAEAKRRSMWARIPRLAELDGGRRRWRRGRARRRDRA